VTGPHGSARPRSCPAVRRAGGAGRAPLRASAGPRRARQPHRSPAPGRRAGLLRRVLVSRGGRTARRTARYRQDADPGRIHPPARRAGGDPMSPDVHTLTGAYAADALPADERRFFEQHLAVCDAVRRGGRRAHGTAAWLGATAETAPPFELKDRVMAEVDHTRQDRPRPRRGSAGGPSVGHPARAAGRRRPRAARDRRRDHLAAGARRHLGSPRWSSSPPRTPPSRRRSGQDDSRARLVMSPDHRRRSSSCWAWSRRRTRTSTSCGWCTRTVTPPPDCSTSTSRGVRCTCSAATWTR
jgi:hypothetical protein